MSELCLEQRIELLKDYDLSFMDEKLVNVDTLRGENLAVVDNEFRRFMELVLCEPGPLAMIDIRADELWHTFILFTPQYKDFCDSVMGFFVHHQPRTSKTPVPSGAVTNFVNAYVKRFGALGDWWLQRLTPELRSAVQTGIVPVHFNSDWSGWTGRP